MSFIVGTFFQIKDDIENLSKILNAEGREIRKIKKNMKFMLYIISKKSYFDVPKYTLLDLLNKNEFGPFTESMFKTNFEIVEDENSTISQIYKIDQNVKVLPEKDYTKLCKSYGNKKKDYNKLYVQMKHKLVTHTIVSIKFENGKIMYGTAKSNNLPFQKYKNLSEWNNEKTLLFFKKIDQYNILSWRLENI
jgi:hypothetical protein